MLKRSKHKKDSSHGSGSHGSSSKDTHHNTSSSSSSRSYTAEDAGIMSDAAAYLKSLEDTEVIERVRCVIQDAHVFKLPPQQVAAGGRWRGADWDQEVWQGMVKVVERGDLTVVLLLDRNQSSSGGNSNIFAVCPVKDGAVDRCVDSSRYFVIRVENATNGRHMFIGMAFNERNDAFDFNTALEDSRREREQQIEQNYASQLPTLPAKDYSIKEGQKIKVSIPSGDRSGHGNASEGSSKRKEKKKSAGGFGLKPSKKDTPRRLADSTTAGAAGGGGSAFGTPF